jgi:transposase
MGGYRSPTAKKKAIIVVAHAILVIIWHVMATGRRSKVILNR